MCGINGFSWADEKLVSRMNGLIKHRGPDGDGVYSDASVTLGHVRLAILDVTEKGRQPMASTDKSLWITYNGEIYNFRKLRGDLEKKGRTFRSSTDTEVVLQTFQEQGVRCFPKFNGIFAFCIYDAGGRKLYLVRDRLGIKPIYYFSDGKRFAFSSEVKAFKALDGLAYTIDENAVLEYYLTKNISSEGFFPEIKAVPPGTYLTVNLDDHSVSCREYASIYQSVSEKTYAEYKSASEEALADELDKLLHSVVKDQLVSDVPLGTICSGGIDSSLITAIASTYVKDLKIFNVHVKGRNFDESPHAHKVAQHLGLELIEEELDRDTYLKLYRQCIGFMDLPLMHPNSVGIYLISRRAKKEGLSVLLSGEGADELFGGYPQYLAYQRIRTVNRLPLFRLLRKARMLFLDESTKYLLEDGKYLLTEYGSMPWVRARSEVMAKFLERLSFVGDESERELSAYILKDLRYYLVPLLRRTDRMPMAAGLEMRVPYLDNRLLSFAANLPVTYKVRFFDSKRLLKKVAERYLPREVVYRRKMGFPLPVESWLGTGDVRKLMYAEWEKLQGLSTPSAT